MEIKKGSLLIHRDRSYLYLTVVGFSDQAIPDRNTGHVHYEMSQYSQDPDLPFVICEYLKPPCQKWVGSFRKDEIKLIRQ